MAPPEGYVEMVRCMFGSSPCQIIAQEELASLASLSENKSEKEGKIFSLALLSEHESEKEGMILGVQISFRRLTKDGPTRRLCGNGQMYNVIS
ncbi:hypothetical protein EAI_03477 [Harpegnathos saltator]|uniref:Uncharacterized protein n=1 Tax=Harpegnathos saltator TaxID=610380 RepID=E2BNR7_HARSA|nr:hypothetical protein EAI_03477 [Harpegnathos saltator]